jgi:hypothetical protein
VYDDGPQAVRLSCDGPAPAAQHMAQNVSPKYPRESSSRIDFSFRPAALDASAITTTAVLSAAAVSQFNELGFTPPLPVFEGEALRRLQREWRVRASDVPGENGGKRRPADEPFRAFHPEDRGVFDVVSHPTTVTALQQLLSSANVVCHISQFVNKPMLQTRTATAATTAAAGSSSGATLGAARFGESTSVYHQDAGFNAMDARCVVAWLAIEDADESNGCMCCIPASHIRCGGLAPCDATHMVLEPAQYGAQRALPVPAGSVIFLSVRTCTNPN